MKKLEEVLGTLRHIYIYTEEGVIRPIITSGKLTVESFGIIYKDVIIEAEDLRWETSQCPFNYWCDIGKEPSNPIIKRSEMSEELIFMLNELIGIKYATLRINIVKSIFPDNKELTEKIKKFEKCDNNVMKLKIAASILEVAKQQIHHVDVEIEKLIYESAHILGIINTEF